jgi:hypothetical protein
VLQKIEAKQFSSLLPEKSTFVPNIYLSLKSIKDSFLKPDLQAIYFQTPTGNMLKNVNCALTLKNLIVDQSKDKEELVEFVIFGVALDKDVKETCISLIDFCQSSDVKNFKLRVVSNACAGTTAKNCEETIEALKTMNVEIVEASMVSSQFFAVVPAQAFETTLSLKFFTSEL